MKHSLKLRFRASSLLEVIVAMTIVLVVLSITYSSFVKVYKGSMTLPKLKNITTNHHIFVETVSQKSFVEQKISIADLEINKQLEKHSIKNLSILSISPSDSSQAHYKLSVLVNN